MRLSLAILFILILNSTVCPQSLPWWMLWEKNDSPVLGPSGGDWCDDIMFQAVVYDNSIFKMYFTGWGANTSRQIGYAQSMDGINWDLHDTPVIEGGIWEDWDYHKIAGSVLRVDDTLRLWFSGTDYFHFWAIGYAWSIDGVEWNNYPDPVYEGSFGFWDEEHAKMPAVYHDGTTYHMYYSGWSSIGYASSANGIDWEPYEDNPVLFPGPLGSQYDEWINPCGLISYNDTLRMFFNGYDAAVVNPIGFFRIFYAWSADFISWEVGAFGLPALDIGPSGSWDSYGVGPASVLIHEGRFKMWYGGQHIDHAIGYAEGDTILTTGIREDATNTSFLLDAFPNPCTSTTKIFISIPEKTIIKLDLLSQKGVPVKMIQDQVLEAGIYTTVIETAGLTPGLYFLVLRGKGEIVTRKLIKLN